MNILDRQRGCLLGLAIGDALGAAVEFSLPGTFEPVQGYRDGGPHGLDPGQWTDDTSLALALADSIAECGWDLTDQAQRYLAWLETGKYSVNGSVFDVGLTTSHALRRFAGGMDASQCGAKGEHSCGNGSIMRIAPVAMAFHSFLPDRIVELSTRAAESSLPTHAHPRCLSACRYLTLVLAGLLQGQDREEVLAPHWLPLKELRQVEPLHADVERVAAGSFREKQPPEIRGSGFVVASLEAALWAFSHGEDFEAAVLAAVNLGDDADTTGAVCGQLAGAFWGESGIARHLLDGLAGRELIDPILAKLLTNRAL